MSNMIQQISVPSEHDGNVYATFFEELSSGVVCHEAGVVHEEERLANGRALGGMRFGGMFDIIDSPLTKAETRVLALRVIGLGTCALADTLHVSENTVRTQQRNLTRKLSVTSMAKAAAVAFSGDEPFFVPYLHGHLDAKITSAENHIIKCLAEGSSVDEIASALSRKETTIRTHLKNAYERTGIPTDYFLSFVTLAYLTDNILQQDSYSSTLEAEDEDEYEDEYALEA